MIWCKDTISDALRQLHMLSTDNRRSVRLLPRRYQQWAYQPFEKLCPAELHFGSAAIRPLIRAHFTFLELDAGDVVADTLDGRRCVFLARLYRAEQVIAERLRCLARGAPPWPPIDADKAIPWVEGRTGLALADSQQEALRLALRSTVLVITGGPGVGKTTLVNSVLKVIGAKRVELALCAPTGRAAKRLSDRDPATPTDFRPQ